MCDMHALTARYYPRLHSVGSYPWHLYNELVHMYPYALEANTIVIG